MDHNDLSESLAVALEAARGAGSTIMEFYGSKYIIKEKTKGQPVTPADLAANLQIQKIIIVRKNI